MTRALSDEEQPQGVAGPFPNLLQAGTCRALGAGRREVRFGRK